MDLPVPGHLSLTPYVWRAPTINPMPVGHHSKSQAKPLLALLIGRASPPSTIHHPSSKAFLVTGVSATDQRLLYLGLWRVSLSITRPLCGS